MVIFAQAQTNGVSVIWLRKRVGQTWRAESGAGRLNLSEWVQYVPFSLNASLFNLTCVWGSPSEDACSMERCEETRSYSFRGIRRFLTSIDNGNHVWSQLDQQSEGWLLMSPSVFLSQIVRYQNFLMSPSCLLTQMHIISNTDVISAEQQSIYTVSSSEAQEPFLMTA